MQQRSAEQHRLLVVPPGSSVDQAISEGLASLGGAYEYVRRSRLDDGRQLLRFRRRS